MPRLPSIPWYLEQKILRRWMHGESPQQILDWIDESNIDRKEPVHTSRSSVERCIERLSQGESMLAGAAACRRLRCRAVSLVEEYDHLNAAYAKALADAAELDGSLASRVRHAETLRVLKAQDVSLARQLKLAGCTGAAAEKLEERAEAMEAADVEKLSGMKDIVRGRHAKQISEVTAQHPDWVIEEVENLVVGDDFADWRAEDIQLERESAPPPGSDAGPDPRAAEDGDRPTEPPTPIEVPTPLPARLVAPPPSPAPLEAGDVPGEHFPVSTDESAAEEGETNRGTSGEGRGSRVPGRLPGQARSPLGDSVDRSSSGRLARSSNGRDGRATGARRES
jgi:hypothetical protein